MTGQMTHADAPHGAEARLAEADAIRDERPDGALALLRRIAPADLPSGRRPRLAWLLNHLLGEREARWEEALERQQAVVDAGQGDDPAIMAALWRQAAVAALLAGDVARANGWRQALAEHVHAPIVETQLLIALAAAAFLAPGANAAAAGRVAGMALRPVAGREAVAPGLEAALAHAASDLAGTLAGRPLPDLEQPDLRAALELAGQLSQRLQGRAERLRAA